MPTSPGGTPEITKAEGRNGLNMLLIAGCPCRKPKNGVFLGSFKLDCVLRCLMNLTTVCDGLVYI